MTTTQQIITIAVVVLGTMTTRFLPFIIFSADSAPEFVRFLGRVLPNAVIGLLVIYSLKDSIGGVNHCIPELIALAFIFILHKWKKNTLLSIAGGTILYMFLTVVSEVKSEFMLERFGNSPKSCDFMRKHSESITV